MDTEALHTISSALLVEVGVALFHIQLLRKTCVSLVMGAREDYMDSTALTG